MISTPAINAHMWTNVALIIFISQRTVIMFLTFKVWICTVDDKVSLVWQALVIWIKIDQFQGLTSLYESKAAARVSLPSLH